VRTLLLTLPQIGKAAGLVVVLSALTTVRAAAQLPEYEKPTGAAPRPAAGRCLLPDQQKVNDNYYALARATSRDDAMPFWDPEYFVGTWDFDMRTQDSPLGSGGQSVGTLTIKPDSKNPCLYEGTLKGDDGDGKPFTRAITAAYDPAKKVLNWTEKDSRGYTIVMLGPIGGELGGLYHHHFGDESSTPVVVGGKKLRIMGVSEMSSPAYFKVDMKFSMDGEPFRTYGRVMYEKHLPDGK
jgi:hypothetical protein